MLYSQRERHPLESVLPVLDGATVQRLQAAVHAVNAWTAGSGEYIVDLAEATRRHPSVQLGCSPRGTLALFRATQARAFLEGRDYAIPEDVKAEAVVVLAIAWASRRRRGTRVSPRRPSSRSPGAAVPVPVYGARGSLAPRSGPLESSSADRAVLRLYDERLTARGRYVLWLSLAVGYLGVDTDGARATSCSRCAAGPLLVGPPARPAAAAPRAAGS